MKATSAGGVVATTATAVQQGAGISAWAIFDEDTQLAMGLSQEQAEFGTLVYNAGGLGDLTGQPIEDVRDALFEAVLYTNCLGCDGTFMQGELDASKRCLRCAS